ncbi:hypothetical protein Tco_0687054 [Tanacetum coccineum]
MNISQDRQMHMDRGNGGNQFRQYAGQNVGNQIGIVNQNLNLNGNGNVVAARAEGNAIRNNGLEVDSIRRIQVLDTAYWGFLRVGTTLDIFQNIHILFLEYGILSFSEDGVLSFNPLWSLVSAGTDMPYLP